MDIFLKETTGKTEIYFLPISDEEIEKTAVLREFIGGSLFE